MGREIERKFLVVGDRWRENASGVAIRQGYLSTTKDRTVRVRTAGDRGWLTVKGVTAGATRREYEYQIPVEDAHEMLDVLCERPILAKTRYRVTHGDHVWEIDEFHGDNDGLIVAEIELGSEVEAVEAPPWIGAEVTDDPRYFNANLVAHPFSEW